MRKFAIPKFVYVLLVLMLGVLSIGYTYAYFSSKYQASAAIQMGKIGLVWRDNAVDKLINNGANSISITAEELDAGAFSKILALTDDQSSTRDSVLELENKDATVAIYCRIKIDATYTPKDEEVQVNCGEQWIQLAYKYGASNPKLISNDGWFYDNGYYYYGTDNGASKTLSPIDARSGLVVANYIYLSADVDAEIYGGAMSIVLTAEAVQTTNNAYQSVWDVSW